MERLLSLFVFGFLVRFLIRIIRNTGKFLPKSVEQIYCDGCGTELPRDELKLELKSIKHSNPTHPEDSIYFRTAANRDKSY